MIYPEIKDCFVGLIGAGNISLALAKGLINSGTVRSEHLSVSAPTDRNLNKFKDLKCFTTNDNNKLFTHLTANTPKIVFLCVKPNVFKESVERKEPLFEAKSLGSGQLIVVSVMAGITINQLKESLCPLEEMPLRWARLMPNTAITLCTGICGLSTDNTVEDEPQFREFLSKLLSPIGLCEFVTESQLNAVCGLGGSGIAFVYSLIHAMSDAGLKMGLPRTVATNLAAQTVSGAAMMVLKTQKNAIVLRDEVTSPAGTTIHGLHVLEKGGFNGLIMDAIESATKRAQELSE